MAELKKWGDEAYSRLRLISGKGAVRKRVLLIELADSVYSGESETKTFRRLKNTEAYVSRRTHYNWLAKDENYRAAYDCLIGGDDGESMGLAKIAREKEAEQHIKDGIQEMERARFELRLSSYGAAMALKRALGAERTFVDTLGGVHVVDDHRARIQAAKEILGRSIDMSGSHDGFAADEIPLRQSAELPDLSGLSNSELNGLKRIVRKIQGDPNNDE